MVLQCPNGWSQTPTESVVCGGQEILPWDTVPARHPSCAGCDLPQCCTSTKDLQELLVNRVAEAGSRGLLIGFLREVPVEALALISAAVSPLQVKMWVQLLIPRIEDGNNFGVSIQVRHHWPCVLLRQSHAPGTCIAQVPLGLCPAAAELGLV